MKQEQIKRMEEAIAADYTNMVGMVIVKDGERFMRITIMNALISHVYMFFR